MEKTTKRIILSIVTLVLVVVALGTTTFAWFTLSNVATVSNIEGEITGGDGLEIAYVYNNELVHAHKTHVGATEWEALLDKITTEDKFIFSAVSPTESTTVENGFSKLNVNETVVEGTPAETFTKLEKASATANQDYLEFDLEFRSLSAGVIYWTEYTIGGGSKEFTPTITYEGGTAGTTQTVYAANGARISVENNIVQNGEDNDNTVMGNTALETGQFSYLEAMQNRIYWPAATAVTDATSVVLQTAAITLGTDGINVAELGAADTNGYHTARVTVRIWLEGWDADTYDALFDLALNFSLRFEKKAA